MKKKAKVMFSALALSLIMTAPGLGEAFDKPVSIMVNGSPGVYEV